MEYDTNVNLVIAVSFERIHRSNLVGMGVVPLQFAHGQSADSLGLTGKERFSINLHNGHLKPRQEVRNYCIIMTSSSLDLTLIKQIEVKVNDGRTFKCVLRFDTEVELEYFRHGGILQYVLRRLLKAGKH